MQAVFAPAIALMNRLSYSKKFLVLGFLSMVAVLVVILNLYQNLNQTISNAERELDGLVLVEKITQAIQATQKHRGIAAAMLGGIANLQQERETQEAEVNRALQTIAAQLQSEDSVYGAVKDIQARWTAILQQQAAFDLNSSFTAHTELIEHLHELQEHMDDMMSLSTDNELDSYHLLLLITHELPTVLEDIGQLKAYGVAVLARQAITPEQKLQITLLKASIEHSAKKIATILEDTNRYNPTLKLQLDVTQKNIANATNLITSHVIPAIERENFAIDPEYFLSTVSLALDSAYIQIFDSFLPTAESLIHLRLTKARHILWLSIGIPGGVFVLIAYFAIGAHLGISRNIKVLALSARAFVNGDFGQRLKFISQDELGLVAENFNAMADGFNKMLTKRAMEDQRFQSIIDTALDAVVQMDAEGILRGWNRQAENIFGWGRDEIIGQPLHEFIIPERLRKAHKQGLQTFLASGEGPALNRRVEVMALHRDGHEFPIEIAITPSRLLENIEFSAFIRDISQQKHALKTLQNSERRFRALFESSRDAIFTLSVTDQRFLSANSAALHLFGCHDEAQFLAHNVTTLSPEYQPDGRLSEQKASEMLQYALAEGFCAFEWQHKTLNGEHFFAEVQLCRIDLEQEILLLATVRDVTSNKRDRAAILTSEARTRAVLRTMPDAVVLIDPTGRMLLVNDAIAEMFGYEEDELVGQNVNILMPEPHASAHDGYLRQHAETKNRAIVGRRLEVLGKHRNGALIPIELSVNELMDDNGSTFIGVMRDITRRKAVDEEREAARLEAERLAHAKSEFLANMSHEIRTPLNAIIGLAKMSIRQNDGRASQQNSTRILDASMHLLNLVNDILDFSKIEAGKMILDIHPFRLNNLITETVSLVELRAKEKQLNFVVEKDVDLPDWVVGDVLRLRQILVNLLSNAVKFTEKGYVCFAIARKQESINFSITDSGIGIAPEQLTRLFTAFEQADSSTTRKFGGSGLGLAISRNLANMMGGDITVKTATGVGSQFTLTVPLPLGNAGVDQKTYCLDNGPRLRGLRVLAAEDVELNRLVLEDLLHQEGAEVIFAENGQQALEVLATKGEEHFDIVLMDIQMPVMDGYQAAREILKLAPELPIIGLTAHAMPEERIRCLEAGMRERVTKPIDANDLVTAILQYIPESEHPTTEVPERAVEAANFPQVLVTEQPVDKIINWTNFLQRYDNRHDFIDKLILNALDGSQQQNVAKLQQAADESDSESIKFIAHSLKGLAGVFQAPQLLELAQRTELAAKNKQQDQVALARQLADTLQHILLELEQHQNSKIADEP